MARAGHTTCPLCGAAEIAITRTGAGTLNLKCHKCEFTGYAKPGTRAARLVAQQMVIDTDDEAPAAPAAAASKGKPAKPAAADLQATPPPPVKKPQSSVFDLGQL